MTFDYAQFTQRNIGFVRAGEQEVLRAAKVLVIGVGGMGGAAVQALVRAGIGHFALADLDTFEISNLNRQVFATLDTVGADKAAATQAAMRRINPEVNIELAGAQWLDQLDALLAQYRVVINGMDDIAAGIVLYRKAREHGAVVIDAYTSPLPSVTVVKPAAPRPEERMAWPSRGRDPSTFDQAMLAACFGRELEYVLVHSSSANHIDIDAARELMLGRRKRMSFAPMVITTGNLMAFEAIKLILGRARSADERGYFFNPWTLRTEHSRSAPVAWLRRALVRRFLARMADAR
jgi:threonine dehydrogenase-like Zn-dependent dehydrogenase